MIGIGKDSRERRKDSKNIKEFNEKKREKGGIKKKMCCLRTSFFYTFLYIYTYMNYKKY